MSGRYAISLYVSLVLVSLFAACCAGIFLFSDIGSDNGSPVRIIPSSLDGQRNQEAEGQILSDLIDASRSQPITVDMVEDAYSHFRPMMDYSGKVFLREKDISIEDASFEGDHGTLLISCKTIYYGDQGAEKYNNGGFVQIWVELQDGKWLITDYKAPTT